MRGLPAVHHDDAGVLSQHVVDVCTRGVGLVGDSWWVEAGVVGVEVAGDDGGVSGGMVEGLAQIQLAVVWAIIDVIDVYVLLSGSDGGTHRLHLTKAHGVIYGYSFYSLFNER